MKYKQSINDLQNSAIRQWPDVIMKQLKNISILDRLLEPQDQFIATLKIANASPRAWESVLEQNKNLSKPLFLKHLLVLSDMGGEALNKLPPLNRYIQNGIMEFSWNNKIYSYRFNEIHQKTSLTNTSLKIDEKSILNNNTIFTNKMRDVAMLILFGSSCINDSLPYEQRNKCIIGTLIGKNNELENFVKQNYIRVSRQVGGAASNALGHLLQDYVQNYIKSKLSNQWMILKEATLPNVYHNDQTPTTFDLVIKSPTNKYCGIEVSFQVTTNSVIERKAREAEFLYNSTHKAGHQIAYVIDGAGNIDVRTAAVKVICDNSDCTVTLNENNLNLLIKFLQDKLI